MLGCLISEDDDIVIGTALAGRASAIITGDKDLLVRERAHGIAVVAPRDFWRWSDGAVDFHGAA